MSNFFKYFPKIRFTNKPVVDILTRVAIREGYLDKDNLYQKYILKDGDTPENIAAKYYDDSGKHWLVMYANNIFDSKFEFPMDWQTLDKYLDKKYYTQGAAINRSGSEYAKITKNPFPFQNKVTVTTTEELSTTINSDTYIETTTPNVEIYYIDDAQAANTVVGTIIFENISKTTQVDPIMIYDWEVKLNDDKREIKLLKKQLAVNLENELKQAIRQ